ncbi:MAG: polysaccharide biosynthesis tyrosine autokinase, partial [Calditrichia bacterium]
NEDQKDLFLKESPINPSLFKIGGMYLKLNSNFIKNPRIVKFGIISKRHAINSLKGGLHTSFDGSGTILTIGFKGIDPQRTTQTVNTIADLFIQKTLDLKRYKTSSILKTLGEQLILAREKLEGAEKELELYKEKHPTLSLSSDLTEELRQLSNFDIEIQTLKENRKHIKELLLSSGAQTAGNLTVQYKEILSFLSANGVPSAQVVLDDYNSLLEQNQSLKNNGYSQNHPQMLELSQKIKEVENRINELFQDYQKNINSKLEQNNSQLADLNFKLKRLPAQETILAKLVRDKEVNERIFSNVLVKYNEAKIADAAIIPDAFLLDHAMIPEESSNRILVFIILFLGLFLSISGAAGAIIIREIISPSIVDENDLKYDLGLPVLSTIPVIGNEDEMPKEVNPDDKFKIDPKLITSDYAPNIIGEKYRMLRTHLLISNGEERKINTILITSLNANEGKSLTISNLAITIAQQKIPTVLIDADLRRGVLHRSLVCEKRPGLSDLLNSNVDITTDSLQKFLQETHVPNLFLLSSGTQIPNPSELVGSYKMRALIDVLKGKFGFLLFDSPPISVTTDAVILSSFVDRVLFVVRSGHTKKNQLTKNLDQIEGLKSKTMGLIINGADYKLLKSNYNYSYYHY